LNLSFENQLEESFTLKRPPLPSTAPYFKPLPSKDEEDPDEGGGPAIIINKSDSLAERVRKMNAMKRQGSQERESSREPSLPRKVEK
jgi:hypothetical protein